jgi:hypothetical protein
MAYIEHVPCLALVDTGSQVTTISEDFHKEYLSNCSLKQLDDILKLEGAGGQDVPFRGYVEAQVSFPEQSSGVLECFQTLVLVVPNTTFNKQVPLVIGTNLIRRCKENCIGKHGKCYLREAKPDLAWRLAYQRLTQQDRRSRKAFRTSKVRIESDGPKVIHAGGVHPPPPTDRKCPFFS